jgi:hypothetical protein
MPALRSHVEEPRHSGGSYHAVQVQQARLAQVNDGVTAPDGDTAIRAAWTVARHARDVDDLRLLLDMLGLRAETPCS